MKKFVEVEMRGALLEEIEEELNQILTYEQIYFL